MSKKDDMPIRKIDHVRFFVGNARQSAYFYRNAYGFDVVAYAGLETKVKNEAGYVLKQGGIHFVMISPLRASHPDSKRLIQHGDGVSDIALQVDDVQRAYGMAIERGAIGVLESKLTGIPPIRSSIGIATTALSLQASTRSTPRDTIQQPITPPDCLPSTISSETSKKDAWTSGSSSIAVCSVLNNLYPSTIRISRRNILR